MKRINAMAGAVLVGLGAAFSLARADGPPASPDCSSLEEWAGHGAGGTGMKFVDTVVGKWQAVWTHPMVQVACAAGVSPEGGSTFEGHIQAPPGEPVEAIRSVWTRQPDGSVRQELLRLNGDGTWEVFYSTISRKTPRQAAVGGAAD